MNTYQKSILKFVSDSSNQMAGTLRDLIRIPTTNPYSGDPAPAGEGKGERFLARLMRQAGGQTRRIPIPRDVYRRAGILGPRERNWAGRENLVGRFRFGRGTGLRIVLNGHMDTVGVSDFEGDPFGGKRKGDIIHGRGASDCKGGLVAGMFAIRALRACGAPWDGEILFESVTDEECNGSGAGTLACCLAGVRGDYCLVLDGTAGMIYTGCQGVMTAQITVRGRAGHGSVGGVSALEKLLVAKKAIDEFARERARSQPGHLVNVGVMRAGVGPWTVPNHAWLASNICYSYGEAVRSRSAGSGFCGALVRRQFGKRLDAVCRADDWLRKQRPELEWVKDLPPFRTEDAGKPARSEQLVAAATESFVTAWKTDPEIGEMSAWGDASHLARVGRMPLAGMGAGEPDVSHTATEYNRISNVRNTAAAVALTILRLAGIR